MSTYLDRIEVAGFEGLLILYKRSDVSQDHWWFRAKVPGVQGYIRRTTKEDALDRATATAKTKYVTLLATHQRGVKLGVKSVREVAAKWLDEIERLGTKQSTRLQYVKSTWARYLDGYFGAVRVSDLSDEIVDGYWAYRRNFYVSGAGKLRLESNPKRAGSKSQSSANIVKSPSYATLRAEASIINEFLKWCYRDANAYVTKQYKISAKLAFGNQRIPLNRRPNFTRDEWRRLTLNLANYEKNTGKHKAKFINSWHLEHRAMFRSYVMLLASTGLRVGEASQLRWRDLEFRHDKAEKRDVLIINVRAETSKVHTARQAVGFSDQIIERMNSWKEISKFKHADDLIFYNIDENGLQKRCDMSVTFRNFLKAIEVQNKTDGMLTDVKGDRRTLYSLRHTYATFRLESGVEVYALAKVMGTGVAQIEKHYGHVAGERLVREAIKGGVTRESEQAKDVARGGQFITMLRTGAISEEEALRMLRLIANTGV